MNANYEAILNTITAEQWEAIAAFAAERAKATSIPEVPQAEANGPALEQRVTDLLRKIGCPAHIKGYRYLRQAVILVYNDYGYIEAMTKALYPELADMYKTTGSRVERAIRHAVEVTFDRGEIEKLSEVFNWSNLKGKPTNSEAIAAMAEYLKNSK